MAKEPIDLGQTNTTLGFEADIDGIVDKFMKTIFEFIDVSGFPDDNQIIDKEPEQIQDYENVSVDNLVNDIGVTQQQLDKINGIEKWFNEIGVPDLAPISENTQPETRDVSKIKSIDDSTAEQIQQEMTLADVKLKQEILNQFPNGDVNLEEAKHTGGVRDILTMLVKAIYKIVGFFAEKFVALLQPVIVLVKQLFLNFDPLNGKLKESLLRGNPFPIIPDLVAYNILIALTSLAPPLNIIHVANQVKSLIDQSKELIDLAKNVLAPVIQFITDPNSLISSLLESVFEGTSFPFPEIDMGFLGIKLPSVDNLGLFNDSELGLDLNLEKLSEEANLVGKPFDSSKLLQSNVQEGFDSIGLDTVLATPETTKQTDKDWSKNLIENSPLMKEMNFMLDIMKNPILQMDYIKAIDSHVKDNNPAINEFYREPYVPSSVNINDSSGWKYNFDFFKQFPLNTSKNSIPPTLFQTEANKKGKTIDNDFIDRNDSAEVKGLWDTIVESELHRDLDFIKEFYSYLRTYGTRPLTELPELAQFMYLNNGAIVQSYKSNKEKITNESATKFNVDRFTIDDNVSRSMELDNPIVWDISKRDYQVYIDPHYKQNKNYKDLKGISTDISNLEEDYKNDISLVNYSVPWDGDILYAYRYWMKDSQRNDYFDNYINTEDMNYFFHSALNNDDRTKLVEINEKNNFKSMIIENPNDQKLLYDISSFKGFPISINYVMYQNKPKANYLTYGFKISSNNDTIDPNKYRKCIITDVDIFKRFWDVVKPTEYNGWTKSISQSYDLNNLNSKTTHSILNATYTDIVPMRYTSGITSNLNSFITGRVLTTTPIENLLEMQIGDIVFISDRMLKLIELYEYYYNIRDYLELPKPSYFFLDTTVNNEGKVIDVNLNSFEMRNKFHKRFLSQNSFFRFKIQFVEQNKMDDLFDFMLTEFSDINNIKENELKIRNNEELLKKLEKESTNYGFVFRTPEIKMTAEKIQEFKDKNVQLGDLAEKNFYNVLKRSYDLNFWNTIPFKSNGNQFNFKYGIDLQGNQIDLISKNIKVSSDFNFKRFKLEFWKKLPNYSYKYFNSYMYSFIVYYKEFTEYKNYLTEPFSDTMRVSNDREVNNETIIGIFENDNFRDKVNANIDVSQSSNYRLPTGERDLPLFGAENYNADGLVDFSASSLDGLEDNLNKIIEGIKEVKGIEGSIPAYMTWFLTVISFIKNLIMLPINLAMTLLEAVFKIIKSLLSLNLPGVVKGIISLIKSLSPSLDIFKNMTTSMMGESLLSSLFDSIDEYNKLGLNENQVEFDKFKNQLSQDSKKVQEDCINKQEGLARTWLQEVGLSETIFVTQDEIKEWLNSVGLDAESIGLNLSKYRTETPNQVTIDALICLSEGNLFNTDPGKELDKLEDEIQKCIKKKTELLTDRNKAKVNYTRYNNLVISNINEQTTIFKKMIRLVVGQSNKKKLEQVNNIFSDDTDVNNLGISAEIFRFAKNGAVETVEENANNIDANWYSLIGKSYLEKLESGIKTLESGIKTTLAIKKEDRDQVKNYAQTKGATLIKNTKQAVKYKKEYDKLSKDYNKQELQCKKLQKTKTGLELADKSSNFSSKIPNIGDKFDGILNDMVGGVPDLLKEFFKIIKLIMSKAFPQLMFDTVIELFKWVIEQICLALPFLCSGKNKETNQPTTNKVVESTTLDLLIQSSINNESEDLENGIIKWLKSVGLDETILD
jgi:hypothetical protein